MIFQGYAHFVQSHSWPVCDFLHTNSWFVRDMPTFLMTCHRYTHFPHDLSGVCPLSSNTLMIFRGYSYFVHAHLCPLSSWSVRDMPTFLKHSWFSSDMPTLFIYTHDLSGICPLSSHPLMICRDIPTFLKHTHDLSGICPLSSQSFKEIPTSLTYSWYGNTTLFIHIHDLVGIYPLPSYTFIIFWDMSTSQAHVSLISSTVVEPLPEYTSMRHNSFLPEISSILCTLFRKWYTSCLAYICFFSGHIAWV